MRFRQEKPGLSEADEQALAREIGALAGPRTDRLSAGEPYWQNLIVRTNRKIDHVTSPMALSISWALRVAIPGVVAVLSFVIGLHYYAPVQRSADNSMATALQDMPEQVVDSLVTTEALGDEAMQAQAAVGDRVFDVPGEQIAEYFIQNGRETTLVDALDDQQADAVLNALALAHND